MPISGHHDLWTKIGKRLLTKYESWVQSDYLDSSSKGKKCENAFRIWLQQFLPEKVKVIEGNIIDKQNRPTTQRDVIVFDHINCPIFKEEQLADGDINILPIEGVIGAVEVNISIAKTEKLMNDADKISVIKKLEVLAEPPKKFVYQIEPEVKLLTHYSSSMARFGYIFAHDTDVSLEKLSDHIADKNRSLGSDCSVDGIFVLKKGVILHGIDTGWTTTRLGGTSLFCLEIEPWDVLLTMASMINQHLALGARGNIPPLEEYFQRHGLNRKEEMLQNRKVISDGNYSMQQSKLYTVT